MFSTIFLWFKTYKWLASAVLLSLAIAGATMGFWAMVKYHQGIGYSKAQTEYVVKMDALKDSYTKAQILAERESRSKEIELNKRIEKATHETTVRELEITNLSNKLNRTSRSMRDTISTLRSKLSTDSAAAARRKAEAALSVSEECQTEYREVAEDAARLANGIILLKEAWPD